MGFLPQNVSIIGYARSKIELGDFKKRISSKIKIADDQDQDLLVKFLEKCTYEAGDYADPKAYVSLNHAVLKTESAFSGARDRVFYMALPPSVFAIVSDRLKQNVYAPNGSSRIIVEKPFGRDSESSKLLGEQIAKSWAEDEVFIN